MANIVTASSRKSKSSKIPLIILAVAVAGTAFLLLRHMGNRSAVQQVPEATEQPSPTPASPAEVADLTETAVQTIVQPEPSASTNNYVKKPGQMMTDDGRILTFPPPKEGEFRTVHSHGKTYKCDSEGNWEDVTPRPLFDNSFEENLVGLSIEGGTFVPGMLLGLDNEAVMEMLKKDVVLTGDETEVEKAKKEAVAEMKGVILDYIEQGGTFDQFVMEMRSLAVQERSMKGKALKKVMGLVKEGKLDEAKAYRDSFNTVIDEQGFSKLKLPAHVTQLLGDEAGKKGNQ